MLSLRHFQIHFHMHNFSSFSDAFQLSTKKNFNQNFIRKFFAGGYTAVKLTMTLNTQEYWLKVIDSYQNIFLS